MNHYLLLPIFIISSFYFLFKSKSINELLLKLYIFSFLVQVGFYPYKIDALITNPIHIRPMDIALILFVFSIVHKKLRKIKNTTITFNDIFVSLFFIMVSIYTIIGIFRFGYAGLAEFRSVFFYVIILMYISVNIKKSEMIPLIKNISTYLISLILLVPLNLILTGNFEISTTNRQFNAFIYSAVTLGFLSGYLYYQYIDRSYKLPLQLLPVFIIMIPYCSHRTVWAIIFVTLPIILYWTRKNKYIINIIVFVLLIILYYQVDPTFLNNRLMAFTNFKEDTTGSWRLAIWEAIIKQATWFGKGLGSRFFVLVKGHLREQATVGAHNGFMQVLYYTGYVGFINITILILYFIIFTLKKTLNTKLTFKELFINRVAFLSAIGLSLYMFGYGPDLISWIYIGFALKWHYLQQNKGKRFETKPSKNISRYTVFQ